MSDFLSKLESRDIVGLVTILCCLIFALSPIVAICWYKIHKNRTIAALKHDMLDRGMSAEEIKTVLDAGTKAPAAMKIGFKE
jgi:hypothetical protein